MSQRYKIWLQHVNDYYINSILYKDTKWSLMVKFKCGYCPTIDGKKVCIFKEYTDEISNNDNIDELVNKKN